MSQRRFPVVCARSRLQKRVTVIVTSVTLMSAFVVAPPETAWGSGAATSCLAGQRAVAAEICIAKDPHAAKIVDAVRQLQQQYSLQSVVFGVWRDGKELVSGATGTAYPGVPATRAMHFRIGNTTETIESTLLLQLVDQGKIHLDDKLSKWYPALPHADEITIQMLASSTSGYVHYVNVPSFLDAYHANVFATWTPDELIKIGTSQPMLFPPGTSWKFSDTNWVLLGEILRRVGGQPVSQQIQRHILDPLQLHNTQMTTTAETPPPVLHGYTNERGPWEDATFWSPSWATYTGDMTSNLSDLRKWATALGTGSLLSKHAHADQIAPRTVGLGPLTDAFYYGLGVGVTNKWVLAAPGLLGYTGVVAYLPKAKSAVVVFTTTGPNSPPGMHYAGAIFNRIAKIVAPSSPSALPNGG